MISFRCAREGFEAGATQLLGGFDGRDRREVHLYATSTRPEQLLVSMHEHLHHELHWSTGWGLIAAMAGLLSEAGVHQERLRTVAAAANSTCRTVHEVFATTISAGAIGVTDSRGLLAGNDDYLAHLDTGLGLAGPTGTWPWQFRESAAQMLLRTLMQPGEIADIADRGFDRLRLRDIAPASRQPDHRLGLVLAEAGQWWRDTFEDLIRDHPDRGGDRGGIWERDLPEAAADMERLKAWEESVLIPVLQETATRQLRRHGLAVLDQDAYLQVTTALRDSFAQLAPDDWQTELLVGARAMTEEPLGAEREALVLHPAPGRLEAFSSEDLTAHATTFLFEPADGPHHVLATWLPGRLLARQLQGMVGDPTSQAPVLALAGRPRLDDEGQRIVPLAFMRPDVAPADLIAMFSSLPTAVLTTLTVTAERATQAAILALEEVFVLIDLPLRLQIDGWLASGWTTRFRVIELNSSIAVNLVVFHLDELPTVWFLSYRSDAGFGELAQLLDRHDGSLHTGLDVPSATLSRMATATSWLMAAWWRLEEVGGDE